MMNKRKLDLRAPVKSYLDWDALTPTCTGCGTKSGHLDDASQCPTCRGEVTIQNAPAPAAAAAAAKRATTKRTSAPRSADPEPGSPTAQPTAADALSGGRWVQRGGVRVWQPTIGPDLPITPHAGGRPNMHGTPVDEQIVVQAYRDGATRPALAELHDVMPRRITHILRRHGVELRDDRTTNSGGANRLDPSTDLVERVRHLYIGEQLSRTEVAARLRISLKAVTTVMARHDIPARQGQSGHGDGSKTLRARVEALGTTAAQIKAWALEQGLIEQIQRGTCPTRLVDAWETAHPQF